jgi:hypothetical protein
MYQQYFDDFYRKTQYRLLELGSQMALEATKGEQVFLEEIAECRDLRRARRVLTSINLTDREKYDFTIRVIDYYRLDKGLNIELDHLCIIVDDGGGSSGSGGGGTGVSVHNLLTGLDAGDPIKGYYGHLSEEEINWVRGQRFVAPVVNYPNADFGDVVNPIPGNLTRKIPNDGAPKGSTFNYSIKVTITPNQGNIQSIKVFKTTGNVENPVPMIDTLALTFTINDTLTADTSYRLEVKYKNTLGIVVTTNTIRSVNFYYPTYIGVGTPAMTEAEIKTFVAHYWKPADRIQIGFQVSNNYMRFTEPYHLTRRVMDASINYTSSWLHLSPNFTFGLDTVTMDDQPFVNSLVPQVYAFDFYLD